MTAGLEAALAHAAQVSARAAERDRAAPVDPALRSALAAAAGPDAPLPLRSVGDRVRRGACTWDDVWRDPFALGPEGVRLVQVALVDVARRIRAESP